MHIGNGHFKYFLQIREKYGMPETLPLNFLAACYLLQRGASTHMKNYLGYLPEDLIKEHAHGTNPKAWFKIFASRLIFISVHFKVTLSMVLFHSCMPHYFWQAQIWKGRRRRLYQRSIIAVTGQLCSWHQFWVRKLSRLLLWLGCHFEIVSKHSSEKTS